MSLIPFNTGAPALKGPFITTSDGGGCELGPFVVRLVRELLVGILFETTIGNEFEKGTVVPLLENNGDGAGTKEGFPTEVTETEFEFECVTDDVLLFTVKLLFKAKWSNAFTWFFESEMEICKFFTI